MDMMLFVILGTVLIGNIYGLKILLGLGVAIVIGMLCILQVWVYSEWPGEWQAGDQ